MLYVDGDGILPVIFSIHSFYEWLDFFEGVINHDFDII
jgi:hypothetical protein